MDEPAPSEAQPRAALRTFWLILALVLTAGVVWAVLRPTPATPAPPVAQPGQSDPVPPAYPDPHTSPEREHEIQQLGTVRLSDDASAKQGDFWLEQRLNLPDSWPDAPVADLYLSLDPATAAGVRVRLQGPSLRLERLAGGSAAPELLAQGRAGLPAVDGNMRLGALWRGGELSVWWNDAEALTWKGSLDLKGPSAGAVQAAGVKLGARRALDLAQVEFRDGFMRESADGFWKPARGRWELTQLTFPERSANPFSLRASFGPEPPADDKLYRDRMRGEDTGIGVMLSSGEGTLHILRITGGSPAQYAGLQEGDTIVAINGHTVDDLSPWRAQNFLQQAARSGQRLTLKILRRGEKTLRDFTLTGDVFRWGTPMVGKAIQPVSDGSDGMILGGEAGWSDYAAEVAAKPLGSGGFGLAVAVASPQDYVLLRWIGPPPRVAAAEPGEGVPAEPDAAPAAAEALQLVRVEGNRATVLAERTLSYRPYEFYRLALDWRGAEVRALVDGVEVFKAVVPGLKRGQVGLYALRGDPVFFDDLAVVTDRASLASLRRPDRALNDIFALEQDMERWANPALEWRRDPTTPWALHTARTPLDQFVRLRRPIFDELEIRLLCEEAVPPPLDAPGLLIKAGEAVLSGGGQTKRAPVGGGPFERISMHAGRGTLEAEVDGVRLEFPLGTPPRGDRVALRGLRNLGDARTVQVGGAQAYEYTFNEAPADWKVASGRWGLLNKWICDPRWSWFGGRSATTAAIWNKRVFSGDQSVDAHLAMMMQREDPPYERAGDYLLTICGDGTHFSSGYTVIVGGGGNYWTRLYRDGVQVAEATEEKFRLPSDRLRHPDKPELHQRWFHLRLERAGSKVRFFMDGERAFEFEDAQPLAEGRVGFGTLKNGVLLSRCRIAFTGDAKPADLEPRATQLFDDGRVINMFDGEIHSRVVRTSLPAAAHQALRGPLLAFKPVSVPALPPGEAGAGEGWRVENGVGGGPLALQWKKTLVDLSDHGVLRFAVRIVPGTLVDLCLKDLGSEEFYRWRLSGPEDANEDIPLIGRLEGAKADGRWHVIQADLGRDWRRFWSRRGFRQPPRMTLRPLLASLDNRSYALGGFGGNALHASYAASDLYFLKCSDVNREPPRLLEIVWPFDAAGDGRHATLRFADPGGSGVDPDTLQIQIQDRLLGGELIDFDEAKQEARVDLWRALGERPLVDGALVPLTLGRFADRAGMAVAEPVQTAWTYKLTEAIAARKTASAPEIEALLDVDAALGRGRAHRAPVAPRLRLNQTAPAGGTREMALYETDAAPPWALEPGSLRVVSLMDGAHFGLTLPGTVYNLAQWPYMELEYNIPSEVPVNLFYRGAQGGQHVLLLNDIGFAQDRGGEWAEARLRREELGPPEDFKDDGTWRKSEIALLKHFAAANGGASAYEIHHLALQDQGYQGNRRGMAYQIHALRALPAARSRGIAFRWTAPDLTGMAEYAAAIDEHPESIPVGKGVRLQESVEAALRRARQAAGEAPGTPAPALSGWRWLHVRSKNAAGQWSPTAHYKFRLDDHSPRIVETEPAAGETLSGKTFRLHFAEDHVILPGSVQVRVNGQFFIDGQLGCALDAGTNILTFDGSKVGERLIWPEAGDVQVLVGGAQDTLGNRMIEPQVFTFKVDRTRDREGPTVSQLRYCASDGATGRTPRRPMLLELSMALDFEETLGHVRPLRDCRIDWTSAPQEAAYGERAIKIVSLADDADVQVMLHKNAWYFDQYPMLHFDYKVEGEMALDLQLMVLGEWYTIRFLGPPGGERTIGEIATGGGNGSWRHAGVNLRALLDKAVPQLPARIISQIVLTAHGQRGCKRGSALWLDNLHLLADGEAGVLEWTAAEDPSGIEGYSVLIDRSPDSEAPKRITDTVNTRRDEPRHGVWYVHVRAVDQAGNWGPTRHLRLDF